MIDYRVHRTASVARGVTPGAFAVIEAGAQIGAGVTVGPGAYIGPGVTVGAGAEIGPHAVILADVPPGASVPPAVVWDVASERAAASTIDAPRARGRKAA